jgi:hypothetical protein
MLDVLLCIILLLLLCSLKEKLKLSYFFFYKEFIEYLRQKKCLF